MSNNHLAAHRSNCVNECLHETTVASGTCGHLVGAYGVVGISRVKDERKSVFHCRRRASAGGFTKPIGLDCNSTAIRLHGDCDSTAKRLHLDRKSPAAGLHIN